MADQVKTCKVCGKDKLFAKGTWLWSSALNSPKGLRCLECVVTANKNWRLDNKEKANSTARAHYQKNAEIIKARSHSWQKANPVSHRISSRNWAIRNKEKCCEKQKLWQLANPNKVWRILHPDRARAKVRRDQAIRLLRVPKWLTNEDLQAIQEVYTNARKIEEATGIKQHVDHIVPLQGTTVSGLHVPTNLQIIPATSNLTKGNSYD